MSGSLLLGIDVGTYSSKGVLVSPGGGVLAQAVVEHGLELPHPGWAEHDADDVWWADVVRLCRSLLAGPHRGSDVAAVAVSAIGPCLLPLDAADRPLRKGILYGVDTRAADEIDRLNAALGEEAILGFGRMALSSQATGPKILWLQRHEPEVWARCRWLTTASSYLVLRLTGEHVMDHHTASHYLPLYDPAVEDWSPRFEAEVAPLAMLPRLGWSDEVAGVVSASAAEATGLRAGTPVAVGAVDALSEAVSVGVTEPGDLMVMYGSTAFFIQVLDRPRPDPRLWNTPGAFAGSQLLAAGTATAGSLTRWWRDLLHAETRAGGGYAEFFAAAAAAPPGADGLLMLPYFSGERTPLLDPKARGVVAGLHLGHGRSHLARAALEGVAMSVRHNLETFAQIGAPPRRLVAVGGGVRGRLWPQIVSDVNGLPQEIPANTVGASYGDAFLAGLASGTVERGDLQAWVGERELVEPDPRTKAMYDERYGMYLELYQRTRGVVHRLAEGQQGA